MCMLFVRWLISDGFVRQSKRALSKQQAHLAITFISEVRPGNSNFPLSEKVVSYLISTSQEYSYCSTSLLYFYYNFL